MFYYNFEVCIQKYIKKLNIHHVNILLTTLIMKSILQAYKNTNWTRISFMKRILYKDNNNIQGEIVFTNNNEVINAMTYKHIEMIMTTEIKGKDILITKMPDVITSFTFPECETLYISNNDKNFIYYHLDKDRFPKLKDVYVNKQHLCHPKVISMLPHVHFHLSYVAKKINSRMLFR